MFLKNSNFRKVNTKPFLDSWISTRNTPWEIPQPMFAICSYNYYRLVYYLLGDNWLFCRLRAQCMIFNVRLFFVWWCVCHYSLQNNVCRVICLDLGLRLTTVTSTLITPDIKITQFKNCLIFTSRFVSNAYQIINIFKMRLAIKSGENKLFIPYSPRVATAKFFLRIAHETCVDRTAR